MNDQITTCLIAFILAGLFGGLMFFDLLLSRRLDIKTRHGAFALVAGLLWSAGVVALILRLLGAY